MMCPFERHCKGTGYWQLITHFKMLLVSGHCLQRRTEYDKVGKETYCGPGRLLLSWHLCARHPDAVIKTSCSYSCELQVAAWFSHLSLYQSPRRVRDTNCWAPPPRFQIHRSGSGQRICTHEQVSRWMLMFLDWTISKMVVKARPFGFQR